MTTSTQRFHLLVVDSGKRAAGLLEKALGDLAIVERAATADTAVQLIALQPVDLVVLQLKLQLFSGIEFARQLKKLRPDIPLITVRAAQEGSETEIVQLGYPPPAVLPEEDEDFISRCRETLTGADWRQRAHSLRAGLKKNYGFDRMLGSKGSIEPLHQRILKVVESRVPVLITGESGTGKELVARMVHQTGNRARKPFIVVNCAAVPEGLLESQFFGHEKGAFTGAVGRTAGKFELAHGGTLFLDEIGELPALLQAKLLRVLEYGEFERVGGAETLKVDVRLITATNRNLDTMVASGGFRADLYYRINVFPLQLPSLRERGDDVTLLAYYFLELASQRNGRQICAIRSRALDLLNRYPWPGNIRELENAVERATLLCDGKRLRAEDFPTQFDWNLAQNEPPIEDDDSLLHIRPLAEVERDAVKQAIEAAKGNIALAARKLEIARGTLYKKLEEHGLASKDSAD